MSDKNMATNSRGNTTLTAFGIRQHLTTIGQSSNCTWPSHALPLPLSVCLSRLWAALSVNFLLFIFVDSFFLCDAYSSAPGRTPFGIFHLLSLRALSIFIFCHWSTSFFFAFAAPVPPRLARHSFQLSKSP